MIIQSAAREGANDISFTLSRTDLKKAMPVMEKVCKNLNAKGILCDEKVAKVAVVGVGMRSHPGVAAKMFGTLSGEGINIEMISTSEIKVACIIPQADGQKAVKLLHKAFQLEKPRA
jgi:aspartate kinase